MRRGRGWHFIGSDLRDEWWIVEELRLLWMLVDDALARGR
jgi:hypothetical protein